MQTAAIEQPHHNSGRMWGRPFVPGQPSANPNGRSEADRIVSAYATMRGREVFDGLLDEARNKRNSPYVRTMAWKALARLIPAPLPRSSIDDEIYEAVHGA
jgi:hypothetical protein